MAITGRAAEKEAVRLLRVWLDANIKAVKRAGRGDGPDLEIDTPDAKLVVEVKAAMASGVLSRAIHQVQSHAGKRRGRVIPVVAVPFMTDLGKRLCADAGISWFDLSGNADIRAPGIRIYVEGKQNRFKRRGRPSTAFAPRSSRIVRALLMATKTPITQRDLADAAGLDDGFTSRIVARLVEDEFVDRHDDGRLVVRDGGLLLDAWREAYAFDKHSVLKGHVTARSGDEALKTIGSVLRQKKIEHAATGLGAAWLLTKFAGFRLTTFFVSEKPNEKLLKDIGFREEERGANVWLVVPNDDAVFLGAKEIESHRSVHPLQAYLDLKAQPERADEAAAELRRRLLTRKS